MAQIFKDEVVIFDLDDLLYKEFDFMRSGFWAVAKVVSEKEPKKLFRQMMVLYFSGNRVFDWLCQENFLGKSKHTLDSLLTIYRTHKPDISISDEVGAVLEKLKNNGNEIGLITDGRSVTQRNKIEALGLNKWISDFIISEEFGFEKPSEKPFLYFMRKYDSKPFVYLADNYNKDFIAPNQLGWRTIALADNGLNIHSINDNLDSKYHPNEIVFSFLELEVKNFTITEYGGKKNS